MQTGTIVAIRHTMDSRACGWWLTCKGEVRERVALLVQRVPHLAGHKRRHLSTMSDAILVQS